MRAENQYYFLLALLYFAVSFVGILHHELWLDESHHWLMARDSNSLAELIATTRPDGHPILWNILLFWVTRFTSDPFWMQFLHILISTSCVIIFLKKAPFPLVFKILFIFGYFMIFEYNIISRNYILGVLFLFLACSIFGERDKKFILLSLYLALAANVHLMFSVIALAFFLTLLLENFQQKTVPAKPMLIGCLIFLSGTMLLALQMASTHSDWFFSMLGDVPLSEKIAKGVISLLKGLFPIPDFRSVHFWNSNLLVNLSKPAAGVLGILAYALPLLLFFKNRKTLFFVYVALIGTQVFFFVTQRAATRFHGMTYIIFIVAFWMEYSYQPEKYKFGNWLASAKLTLLRKPIIYAILLIHFLTGVTAYAMDFHYPFTKARETVDYLKAEKLDALPVLSLTCDGTSLSPYLGKKVWFLCDGSLQSYCHWDFRCAMEIDEKEITALLVSYMKTSHHAVFVSYYPAIKNPVRGEWKDLGDGTRIRFLEKFDGPCILKDNYYVFEVDRENPIKNTP